MFDPVDQLILPHHLRFAGFLDRRFLAVHAAPDWGRAPPPPGIGADSASVANRSANAAWDPLAPSSALPVQCGRRRGLVTRISWSWPRATRHEAVTAATITVAGQASSLRAAPGMSRRRQAPYSSSSPVSGSGTFSGGRQAFQTFEQFFLAHAVGGDIGVVGIHARAGRADERNTLGLGFVDLDVFLQRMNEFLLEVLGRNRRFGNLAQAPRPGSCRCPARRRSGCRTRSSVRGGSRAARDRTGSRLCRCNLQR